MFGVKTNVPVPLFLNPIHQPEESVEANGSANTPLPPVQTKVLARLASVIVGEELEVIGA